MKSFGILVIFLACCSGGIEGGKDADGEYIPYEEFPEDADGGQPIDEAGDPGGDDAGFGGDDAGPQPERCEKLSAPSGNITSVTPTDNLPQIVLNAQSGDVIVLADGNYNLGGDQLNFRVDGVTMRSESGDPESVTIDGEYQTGEIVAISANDITIAEVTLTKAYYHPIHVTGRSDSGISGTWIYRVRIIDPAEQAIKINSSGAGYYTDYGKVECCHIELTDAGRPHIRNNCYTGGVDAHEAWGWEIRDNLIKGFWCDTGLSEHGIHMWQCCRDTLVERNTIIDCARGIGFGMGDSGTEREYPDDPYPGVGYIGHYDGIIRNNFIFATIDGFDSGILLEQARGSQVVHNTVVSLQQPFNCIEWRWSNTLVEIKNNLLSHNLMDRGGTAELGGNVENAPGSVFENRNAGELHLVSGAASCIDQGVALPGGLCDEDIDGDPRDANPDVGADEYVE
jgi:hypothetical protein